MSELDRLVEKYAADLKEKCGISADMGLLMKVAKGCGPSIYKDDASTVASSDTAELGRVKTNFLMKKLGLAESADLDAAIDATIEKYGRSNRTKHRVVFYYLLVKHFGKEAVYA